MGADRGCRLLPCHEAGRPRNKRTKRLRRDATAPKPGATLAAPLLESPMPSPKPFARPLRLYAIGHALMLFGAGVMQA
ncbi:MAG: hypothetical protein ABIQ06_01315, partial [Caldimonas sp.]